MNMQVRGRLLFALIIMLDSGSVMVGMEAQSDKVHKLHIVRPGEVELPLRVIEPATTQYQHGMSLIRSLEDCGSNISEIQDRICQFSLADQQEIIKAAECKGDDFFCGLACDSYAQALVRDEVMQSLYDDSDGAKTALELGPCATRYLVKKLNKTFPIDSYVFASQNLVHRLYNLSTNMRERQDTFIMPVSFSDDVISIQRDFCGKIDWRMKNGMVPVLVRSAKNKFCYQLETSVFSDSTEQASLAGGTEAKPFCFNGRTYQLSPDGSFMLGFTGDCKHDIDTIIIFDRMSNNKFEPNKIMYLDTGVLTLLRPINKQQAVKEVPFCTILYDIQSSFVIHPFERKAAYIDTAQNIWVIDLSTDEVTPLATDSNVLALGWSSDGNSIVWSTSDRQVFMGMVSNGRIEKSWVFSDPVRKLQWSADGSKILCVTDVSVLLIVVSGGLVEGYSIQTKIVQASLSDDGTKILTAAVDGTILFWDVAKNALVSSCKLDNAHVITVQISPDSRYAYFTCEHNGTVSLYVWNIEQNSCVRYNGNDENSLSQLGTQLKSGWPSADTLTLSQMMLFVACAKAHDKMLSLEGTHYLATQFATLPDHLRKIIASRITIK